MKTYSTPFKLCVFIVSSILTVTVCGRPEPTEEQPTYVILSTCQLPGYAEDIEIANESAYIANGQAGLQIVDVSQPDTPSVIGSYITSTSAQGIAIRDSLAFIATSSGNGLVIVDVQNPAACSLVGTDPGYTEYNIFALPDSFYVYIAALDFFIIENCSIPQFPYYDERIGTPGDARGIFVHESLAYIACEQMGLNIYYAARPDSEVYLIGSIDTPSNARNVYVNADYAYIADGRGGLVIIDISQPAQPLITGVYDTPGYANDVFILGGFAYVADGDGGIQVIDINDPQNPMIYGMIETSYANAVQVVDTLIFIADRDLGLIIACEETP